MRRRDRHCAIWAVCPSARHPPKLRDGAGLLSSIGSVSVAYIHLAIRNDDIIGTCNTRNSCGATVQVWGSHSPKMIVWMQGPQSPAPRPQVTPDKGGPSRAALCRFGENDARGKM